MSSRRFITILGLFILVLACISSFSQKETVQEEVVSSVTPVPVRTVTISAAGDCTFGTDINTWQTKSFVETAEENGNAYFMQNVKHIFADDDLTIVNFEGTLSENGTREDKLFAFRGLPSYAGILTEGNIEAASLSNNHSRDYGEISYKDTHNILNNAGITVFDSVNINVYEVNGLRIGLFGINQLNDIDRTRLESAVTQVKSYNPDIIIAYIHWGMEKATEPNDEQIEYGHRAIDLGVDLVLGAHPHVLQGIESYNGGTIAYSLGNFCFGGNDSPADMDTIIYRHTFTVENGVKNSEITLVPCTISSVYETGMNNYQPTPATGARRERIINKMEEYNAALGGIKVNYY